LATKYLKEDIRNKLVLPLVGVPVRDGAIGLFRSSGATGVTPETGVTPGIGVIPGADGAAPRTIPGWAVGMTCGMTGGTA